LILDEATASLDSRQVQRLFELIRQWKTEDKAIVFVSHRMEEIFQIADRYSVLRNGKTVDAGIMKEISEKELVNRMVGKDSVYGYSRPSSRSGWRCKNQSAWRLRNCKPRYYAESISPSMKASC